MSTSFQNKTSALFASVSRGVATAASKNHSYASAMSNVNINNNNIINNNNNNTTTTSFTMASNSHLSKGLSLLGGLGSLASGHLQSHNNNNNNMNNNNNNNNENNNNNNNNNNGSSRNDIVLSGYLRKFKTMKKKFFVLYSDSCDRPARLEYFDSEKKFRSHSNHPKRSIVLQSCFNINRKTDTKHKCVIALYTKDDSFCIVYDNEQELNKWLHKLLALQNGEEAPEGEPPRPTFEHVWSVQVQRKGIAESKGILGCYHLCLTEKTLTLNRFGPPTTNAGEPRLASVEFLLTTIRKCGNLNCFFYMEVGRHSVIGAGELWMETEDALIAENMHSTIIKASTGPGRPRSSSANEASKPLFMNTRRQTHTGTKPMNFSPSSSSTMGGGPGMAADGAGVLTGMAVKRERCDSLPSRNRTISDGGPTTTSFAANTSSTSTAMPPPKTIPSLNRPHSMYNRHSNSPLSPSMCSESDGSSISIDEPDGPIHLGTPDDNSGYFSRFSGPTPNNAILEESDEYWNNEKAAKRSTERIVRGHVRTGSGVTSSLSLPIAQGQANNSKLGKHNGGEHQGVSPAMHGTSSDGHSNYMDMYSPSGSSPGDPIGNSGYLPMSPGVDLPRSLYTGSSSTHSRASSLTEENLEMAMKDEQYVDMDMSHNQHNVHGHSRAGGLSSAASSSSITSGTPSTDTRFADYPLEKVCAQFGPDEDDNSTMSERPLRAYSVGSRMEHNKRKFRIDHSLSSSLASNSSSNSRMRAFSVGSRAKVPRSDQYKSSCMGSTPAQIAMMNSMMNDNNNNKNGKKSSSVPMLDNVAKCDKSAKGSNEELMNDFMELDFSASVSPAGKISEGMDEDQNMQVDIVTTPIAVPQPSSVANHDYLNVMPTSYCKPITKIDGYVEMHPVGLMNNSVESISSSPVKHPYSALLKAGASLKSNLPEEGNYLDMRGKDSGSSTASPKTSQQSSLPKLGSTKPSQESDYLNMSPLNRDLSSNPTSTNVPSSQVFPSSKLGKSAEEGYLEMSFSRQTSHHSTASNSSSSSEFQRQQEKFIHQRKSMMNNPANSIRSLPIDINYSATNYNGTNKKTPDSTTPITPRNTVGVLSKFSSEDSPFLPANVSNIQTPSNKMTTSTTSTPTIFPFSPGSPSTDKKPNFSQQPRSTASSFSSYGKAAQTAVGGVIAVGEIVTARKCLVDGTTGTIKLSEAEDEVNRPVVTMKIGNSVENSQTDDGDYVNCAPASFQVVVKPESVKSAITVPSNGGGMDGDLDGDYVLMNPKTKIRRKSSNNGPDSTTLSTQSLNLSSSTSHLTTTKPLSVNTTNNSSSTNSLKSSINFRPIPSSADKQVIMQQQLDSANLKGLLNRQFSLNTVDEARSDLNSNYELLRTTSGGSGSDLSSIVRGGSANNSKRGISSRPSSVNSDKITSRISTLSLNRPNSANSDRLSTISSSSSSTSTLCGGGSSSSSSTMTLCGTVEMQKSQSPMSTLRLNSSSSDANEGQMANGQLTSRPPSVTSEKELHYASLDLPPCSVTPVTPSSVAPLAKQEPDFITSSGSSSNLKRNRNSIDSSSSSSATTTPSPNVNTSSSQPVSAFNYAQIDFDKCETIKQQPQPQPQQPPQ